MSLLHHLVTLPSRPITRDAYLPQLQNLLRSGIPATYTLEQLAAYEKGDEEGPGDEDTNTTPLHIMARSLPEAGQLSEAESEVVLEIMDTLFQYGAGWNFLDYEQKHAGDLLLEKGYGPGDALYERLVEAGVAAELLLRKVNGGEIEFLDGSDTEMGDKGGSARDVPASADSAPADSAGHSSSEPTAVDADATAAHQDTYLQTELEYIPGALVTKHNRDGVMMDWETDIMRVAAASIVKNREPAECQVLNIGFGMGIIDGFLQEQRPTRHYICEAHPDVLARMRREGWYERPDVVILEGRWQDTLSRLLDDGTVFFDGIYYDTFSEHYTDMLELYDLVVGLIKPCGIFSFFNGLGADRQVCYDVYRRIVELDMATYGMTCEYTTIDLRQLPTWDNVRRSYFNCDHYYHPEISFQ
ncbi:ADR161Wp [Eremothecium gossypii ATCC 10895]|uniref:Protein arginine N-methyltransferase 2 n=1 Tax=Eremothecium gossypii (strain ATCC 10895 / CBS 109.51 / FGSC 9923 / NRRL Y-1056) TaxID=284811 RepID=RMT2_EREGS|nr:ADR161Wp [Eremothecium gossypii ATCC 10895]Q759W1.1 RecName: Full=Protein arginine N-methyltransferase 2; AltName: Full=Protein-arginine N5-methyltransferase; AltName: Full=Type IV protein arginine N-methyltransferase; Short=Type IV PRMT [Eremothecium gossypii ATCC 10895]AAS52082.1 ADR161Wp [Eremothecium gossypii ATCC 10895]AEY96381.1 FADR161Wp [Eremothecium gossypii FDAG1]